MWSFFYSSLFLRFYLFFILYNYYLNKFLYQKKLNQTKKQSRLNFFLRMKESNKEFTRASHPHARTRATQKQKSVIARARLDFSSHPKHFQFSWPSDRSEWEVLLSFLKLSLTTIPNLTREINKEKQLDLSNAPSEWDTHAPHHRHTEREREGNWTFDLLSEPDYYESAALFFLFKSKTFISIRLTR